MKTNETSNPLGKTWDEIEQSRSTRKQAIAWWKTQGQGRQNYLTNTYIGGQRFSHSLTGREIEEIWLKETGERGIITNVSKPNQKQFKQFDESLFKTYIDKFSDEDKRKALQILCTDLDMMLSR